MMHHESQRNWFPMILGGLSVLLAAIFYARFAGVPQVFSEPRVSKTVTTPAVTSEGYQSAVNAIFATYAATDDAQAAYDALIVLHVPGTMQQFHIDCIIALGKIVSGDDADGAARLDALRAQHSWLTL